MRGPHNFVTQHVGQKDNRRWRRNVGGRRLHTLFYGLQITCSFVKENSMRQLQLHCLIIVTGMMVAILLASVSSNHVNAADPVVIATAATAANQIADDGKLRIICFGRTAN